MSVKLEDSRQSTVSRGPRSEGHIFKGSVDSQALLTPVKTALHWRDWVVIVVELFVAYCGQIIRHRKNNREESVRLSEPRNQIELSLLFLQGWGSIGSLLVAVLADWYAGIYYVGLGCVAVNFAASCLLLMENVINSRRSQDPYNELVSHILSVAIVFIKSTEFSRMVYGLDNLKNKTRKTINRFLFIFVFVGNEPTAGGLMKLFTTFLRFSKETEIRLSVFGCGISLILYLKALKSNGRTELSLSRRASARDVIRYMFKIALNNLKWSNWRKHDPAGERMPHKVTKKDLEIMRKIDKLFKFFILVLPTVGYTLFLMGTLNNLYSEIDVLVKPSGPHVYTGIPAGLQLTVTVSMLLTYFILKPISGYFGLRMSFDHQFAAGYVSGILALYYCSCLIGFYEPVGFDSPLGLVRIFNTGTDQVMFVNQEHGFNRTRIPLSSHKAVTMSYVVTTTVLMRTTIVFGTETNFTAHLAVTPEACTGYVVLDPPDLVRIPGFVPLWSGPSGSNDHTKARIYLFSTDKLPRNYTIKFHLFSLRKVMKMAVVTSGAMLISEIPPGRYYLSIDSGEKQLAINLNQGGVYGFIIYTDRRMRRIVADALLPGKEHPSFAFTVFAALYGISLTYALIALYTMCFKVATSGLLSLSFGYLAFLAHLTDWILLIGFLTWHNRITSSSLITYCILLSLLLVVCLFVFMKYSKVYNV